jgi:hypothetical protein
MTTYSGSIDINAPAGTVSALLHDMPRWTTWTTTVREATPLGAADMSPGTRVRVRQPGLPTSVWTVDRADGDGLEWNNYRHGLLTVATHRIEPTPTGCRLSVRIEQSGLLDLPVRLLYRRLISRHLARLTAEIKVAAETPAAPPSEEVAEPLAQPARAVS